MADEKQRGWNWDWITFGRVATIIGLVLLALLVVVIWQNGLKDALSQDGGGSLLTKLGQVDFGRFLITSFIVLIVVIIASQMAIALFNTKTNTDSTFEKRFSLGRELLTVFIGLLGTLMGFYFAENRVSPDNVQKIANTVQNPTTSATNQSETKAFDLLIKQDYDGAVKAFDDASKATPPSSNIANISAIKKYLADNGDKFSKGDEAGKKQARKDLYCTVNNGGMAIGQSKEIIDRFASGCNPPPAPTPQPTASATIAPVNRPANTASPAR